MKTDFLRYITGLALEAFFFFFFVAGYSNRYIYGIFSNVIFFYKFIFVNTMNVVLKLF